jgi:hypothetical protein
MEKNLKPYNQLTYSEFKELTKAELNYYLFTDEVQANYKAANTISNQIRYIDYQNLLLSHPGSPLVKGDSKLN